MGFNHKEDKEGVGKEGMALVLANKWAGALSNYGSVFRGRMIWCILFGLPDGEVGFLNLYAPNDPPLRCQMWRALINGLPKGCRWVISGGFNFIEYASDRIVHCSKLINLVERSLWNKVKQTFDREENFSTASSLRYSWDNIQEEGHKILARLDRIYVFNDPRGGFSREITSYRIRGDCRILDHLPIMCEMVLGQATKRASRWKMNSKFLDKTAERIKEIWNSTPYMAAFFRKIVCFYKEYCKTKAAEF